MGRIESAPAGAYQRGAQTFLFYWADGATAYPFANGWEGYAFHGLRMVRANRSASSPCVKNLAQFTSI